MAGVAEDEIEHQEAGENVEQFAVAEPPPEEEEFVEDDPAVDEEMDLFTRDSKFNELRINNNNTIGLMKQSLQRTKSHTYSNAIILSLDDLPMCKASELDEIAFVVFPLVAAIEALPDQIATASLIGYWLCLRMMASTWELSVDRIGVARVASLTKELWMALAPKIFTMKCHWFFDHAMQEELEQYGSTYQWSSAPFESHHRRLQIKINQTTTASSSVIIDKFLLAKKLRLQVVERSENSADMRKLSRLIDNTYRTRFPVGVFVTEDLYIPKYSEIQRAELREDDRGYLRLQADDIPYSRVVVRDTVYSSKIYWKRQPSSQQDVVYLTGTSNGQPYEAFENVIMFLCNPTTVSLFRLLLQKMTDPPTAIQKYVVRRNAELRILIEQREDWKMLINKALQLALRDIRNYEYGEVNGVPQWIKNNDRRRMGN
ncbi:hypothetical protein Q1695_006239 [Nippostrongylus brasiliensis]|nr:hypothetical protein Q1695_006239 [Nippostrongylus brasiliensis]